MNLADRMGMDPTAITWDDTDRKATVPHRGFKAVEAAMAAKGAANPGALAAYIGKKKYGPTNFAALAAAAAVKPGDKSKVGKRKKRRAADILKAANMANPK